MIQMTSTKVFSSGISQEANWQDAVDALASKIKRDLSGRVCHMAICFVSEHYSGLDPKVLLTKLQTRLNASFILGCNTSGVIGDSREIEMQPAISVMAMHLPEVRFSPFVLPRNDLKELETGMELIKKLDIYPTDNPKFMVLADPMNCDVNQLLNLFNDAYGPAPVVGGLASGVTMGTPNWMILKEGVYRSGAIGMAFNGNIDFEVFVSQGCRPIGRSYVVTHAEQNVIYEIAGKPALEILDDMIDNSSPDDRRLANHALYIGMAIDEKRSQFGRGDFLVRNIMGMDRASGAIVAGEKLKNGQTIQFHLRDAQTSQEDLRQVLQQNDSFQKSSHEAAFLVSCCGRGRSLYGVPDHDIKMIQSLRGPFPATGFFANGEFGPMHNKNYVHGYTSSLTILR